MYLTNEIVKKYNDVCKWWVKEMYFMCNNSYLISMVQNLNNTNHATMRILAMAPTGI